MDGIESISILELLWAICFGFGLWKSKYLKTFILAYNSSLLLVHAFYVIQRGQNSPVTSTASRLAAEKCLRMYWAAVLSEFPGGGAGHL